MNWKFADPTNQVVYRIHGDGSIESCVVSEISAWIAAGNTPDPFPNPTFDDRIAANTAAIQAKLDERARSKGYDDIVSACSYAAQPAGAPFQAEGAAFLQWRSAVWAKAYATLADVQTGKVPMPTPAQAVADMPEIVWLS